jgi:S1-C subfamily serine protease
MRGLILVLVAACTPKVQPTTPRDFDEDFAASTQQEAPVVVDMAARPEAPKGAGVRTGTIDRARMVAVLDAGVPSFLRQFEVAPHIENERFIGWQLVQMLDQASPLTTLDVAPGDVLLAVNGKPLSRPDQLQTVWDSLRTANQVIAELWRGNAKFQLRFDIEPKIAGAPDVKLGPIPTEAVPTRTPSAKSAPVPPTK